MKYTVVISDKAKLQIAEHISFVSNINKDSAKKLKKKIIETLKSLSEMPRRYPYLNGEFIEKNHYRKMPLEDRYLAVYHIEDNLVRIDYVLDCRRDYGWLLK
ncbi:MAG: type II toxin-antitoxin system RelE/ParE family toxin [Clostridia bacterium]|nr:type II toxin-antitoxin system RelE/ParE family toxin [Clostridia bacterium]